VVGDGGTDELVRPADGGRRPVWVLLPHPRRAFDVGQQEGDGACWQRRRYGPRRTRCWLFVAHRAGRHAALQRESGDNICQMAEAWIAASGKDVDFSGIDMARVEDGRLVEEWMNWDALGLLRQVGAVPALAQGA
jgi:hypothetical protein